MLLEQRLSNHLDFKKPPSGLAVWMKWKNPINLMQLSHDCTKDNLFIPKTLLYQNKHLTAMRLGFGNLSIEEMEKSIDILSINVKIL